MKKNNLLLLLPFLLLVLSSRALCGGINEKSSKGFEFLRQILFNEGIKDSQQIQTYFRKYDQLM